MGLIGWINIICKIATSIGTVGAVCCSLYYTYRSNNPKPNIFVYIESPPPIIVVSRSDAFVGLCIINKSNMPTKLKCVFAKIFFSFINNTLGYHIEKNTLKGDGYLQLNRCFEQILGVQIDMHSDIQKLIKVNDLAEAMKAIICTGKSGLYNRIRLYFCSLFVEDIFGNIYKIKIEKSILSTLKKEIAESAN